ncbi:MAG: Ig-like domain-containing protein [Leptolyngbya sp. BL-A-14]
MPDIAGNSIGTATSLNLTANVQTLPDIVTSTANDYYRFTLSHRSSFNLSLTSLSADANVALLSSTGSIVSVNGVQQTSSNTGNLSESINTTLDVGTYYIQVTPGASVSSANYSLNVSAAETLRSDILWRNYATGENVVWQVAGTSLEAFASLDPLADSNWAIQGSGDFNRDGQSDIVWRNYKTGENAVWFMNGAVRTSATYIQPLGDLNWQIQGVGDFNQDGQSDLVWRNYKTGENAVWFMNGAVRTSATYIQPVGDSNWHIQAAGDFNSDGKPDLVWRNYSTGQNAIWLMNGTICTTGISVNPIGDTNWKITGVGDFNGDGKTDFLWRNYSTGENAFWLFNGTTFSSGVYLNPVGEASWRSFAPFIRTIEPTPISVAGSALSNAFNIGSNLTGSGTYHNSVGNLNSDYYQLNLSTPSAVNLTLTGLTANLDVQLVNSNNQVVQSSTLGSTSAETITSTLTAGTYYVRVYAASGGTSAYALNLLVNNLPVVVTNAGLTLDEGTTTSIGSTLLQVTDNDNPITQLTYTLGSLPGHGALSLNGAAIGVGATFTQTDINTNKLSYRHDGSETLSDSFSFTVADGAGGTIAGNTFNITVNPVNDPPALTVPAGQTVDQNANSLIAGISIADPDVGTGSETITISAANGLVSLGLTAGLTFAQGNGSPATSLTVSGTLSALNNALTSLIYRSNTSFQGLDTISVVVNDNGNTGKGGALTDSKTIAVTVNPVNKAPTITVPAAQSVNEDTSLSLTGISIGDLDANGGNETVSLTAVNGVLTLGTTAGLTFSTGNGSKNRNITMTGTLALINAALQSLTYQADKDFNGSDVVTISVNDNGNTGNGVALSDTKSLSITVTPVNDAPILTVPAAQTVNENTILHVTGINISDVDASSGAITVSLAATNGKLSLGSTTGLSFTNGNGSTPSTSLIFSGTLAAVNSALSTLLYQGTTNFSGADLISINVNDNGNTGFGIPLSDSKTIALTVLGVNQAPVIQVPLAPSATVNTNLTITGISISDPDAAGSNETVTIVAANGVLSLPSNTGLTFTQGTGVQNSRITFQGTLAAINTAIGNLVYRSYPGFTGFDSITISVNDQGNTGIGTALSDTKTMFVNVGGAVSNPPIANTDSYSTTRNTALIVSGQGVLTNDTDPQNIALTANLLTTPTSGSVVFNSNGTFTYTPNANFVGTDSFTYQASDGISNSSPATVNLTITAPPALSPTAVADVFTLTQNSTFTTGNVLTNDTDPNGLSLTAQLGTAPTHGSLTLNSNGTFTYIPTTTFAGTDSFTYLASDASGAAPSTATVSLSVTALPPVAAADSFTIAQNSTFTTGNVLTNDTDPSNLSLTAQLVSNPSHGSLTLNSNGTFTYIPTTAFAGTDSFTYVAKDATGTSGTTTVSLTVTALPPLAVADNFTLTQNSTFTTGNVLANDTDPSNLSLTAQLVSNPSHGSLTLNSNGTFTYIPTTAFAGTDSFTYVAKDATGTSGTTTVSLTVNALPPVAVADNFTLLQNSTFTTGNVLTNDTDPSNLSLTAQLVSNPSHGSVTLNSNGTFTYIPTTAFAGTDSFTYVAKDATGTSGTTTVSLTVNALPPIAVADTFTLLQNSTFTTGNVLTNDTDPSNLSLTAQLGSAPTHGSLTLNSNGTFTYIPTTGYTGTDSFTYVTTDASGAAPSTATVSLTVNAVAQSPTAVADTFTLSQNSTFTTGNVLANDTDPNGLSLTAQLGSAPTHGSLTLNSNGTFTYIPTTGYTGTDSFTYVATDTSGAAPSTATVSLTVNAVAQSPTAVADTFTLSQNSTFTTGNVLANDTDPNGLSLTAQLGTAPTHGSLTLNSNGTFTYIPTTAFAGTDSFTYVATDASGAAPSTATVSLTVTALPPVAVADSFTLSQNSTFTTGNVLANDTDPSNLSLTAQLGTAPTHGSLTLNSNGTFTYIPTTGYTGTDSFTYLASDASGAAPSTATVSLTVNAVAQSPTAVADTFTLSQNSTFTTGNVLANDTDPNGLSLTAQLGTAPTHGSLTLNSDGTFTYIPTTAFAGTDSFTYVAKDASGAAPSTATVSLTVTALPPVAVADSFTLSQNSTFTTGNVLANDTDPSNLSLTAQLGTAPTHGSLTLNSDGTFTYIPTTAFAGTDSFTYVAKDATGTSGTTTVSLTVNALPPVAVADSFALLQDSTFTIGNVLANDTDPSNLSLTAQLGTAPTHGSLTLNSNGTFTYIPTTGYTGTDSFTYIATDASGAAPSTATVSLTVNAVAQSPTAVADTFTLTQNSTFTTGNVLANDTDFNGLSLTAQLGSSPTHGSLTLNSDGTFTYIPTTGYIGTDSFTYLASDASGVAPSTATVSLTVNALPPVAVADSFTLTQNSTFTTGNVLANDTDPNGLSLTAQLGTAPTHGSLTLNSDGTFTYIPTTGYSGTDSFTYLASDANGAAPSTATVSLTVTALPPVAVADSFTLPQNSTFTTGNVLTNDTDPSNLSLTAQLGTAPTHGSLTLNSDGTFTYIPTTGYSGTDSFTYLASDANGAAPSTATVSLTVNALPPVAVADSFTLSQNSTFTTGNVLTNDTDPSNLSLTAQLGTAPTHGSLTLNSDGTFTYIPTTGYSGTDSFTYLASDANGAAPSTATVSLTVTALPPVAVADSFTLPQNSTFTTGNVLTNDTDPSNLSLTAQLGTAPTHGSLTLNSDGTFTYIPTTGYSGTDSFTYLASDANGAAPSTATVSLTVNALPPAAVADSFRAVTNTPLTVSAANGVLKNDTDPNSLALTALLVSTPGNGSLTLNSDGSFVYTPTTSFVGTDTFVYKANDGLGDSNPATVTLTVSNNTAPVANADSYTVSAGVPLTVNPFSGVLQNDSDAESDPLTASLVTSSTGSLTLNSDGSFVYTPNAGVTSGTDTFVYRVSDGFVNSSPATVTLSIGTNVAPIAQNDTYSAFSGSTLTVNQFSGVLSNDTDTQPLTATVVNNPGQGSVNLNSDGSFTYVPNASFTSGTDTFVYQASDGSLTAIATVTLNVSASNAPIVQNDTYQVVAGSTLSVGQTSGVLSNDSSTNGTALTAQLVSNASQGTATLNSDGTFTYKPNAGVTNAADTFVYRATDGTFTSSPATVTLSIVSNALPVVSNDNYSVITNTPLTITTPGVLANDTDSDAGQTLKVLLVAQPTHGGLLLRADGSFVYTPDQGYVGADSFTYKANDGLQDSASVGTVSLTIAANAAPVANADTYSVNKNNVLIKTAASGVLQNDIDALPLTASIVNGPTKGTLTLNSDGSFSYTPNAGVTNTTDTFVYKASDGTLSTNATVTITIKDTSSPPTAVNDTGYTVNANGTLTIAASTGVLTNDTDPEGDQLKAVSGTAPTHGTVSLNSDGSFVYTPTAGYLGTDSFTYFANDGISNSLNPATVSITVGGSNLPPTIQIPSSQVVFRNSDLVIQSGLSIGDPDAGSSPVAVTLTSANGNLTLSTTNNLTVTGNGSQTVTINGSITNINAALTNLVYHPVSAGFTGVDQIAIAVNDNGNTGSGGAQTTNAVINVNVTDGPALVKDINPTQNATATGTSSSTPGNLTNAGGTLYFTANDGSSGVELWSSSGTSASTNLVFDINTTPDTSGSSNPTNLTAIGNTLYFTANNSVRGTELWKADLTGATSPTIVKDIRSGSSSSNPRNLVNFNGTLYFEADDGSGLVLWKTDGTSANTVKVELPASYSQPGLIVAAGNTLFFTAGNGTQLWRLSATGTQTSLLQDIGTGAGIANLVAIGNTLFFTATNSSNGLELWRSDGTSAGTTRISDINPGTGDSSPSSLVNVNGTLYFVAKNGSNVYGLWQSTAAGVVSLVSALPSAGQVPTSLTVVGSKVFFIVDAGTSSTPNLELWQSNGTTTSRVKDINTTGNDAVASLTNVNGTLFFTANDGSTRIWKSDGTDAGTVAVSAGYSGITPHNLTAVGNRLFFTAETSTTVLVVTDPNNPTVFTQITGTTGEELFVL